MNVNGYTIKPYANLRCANLSGASLSGANLRFAVLVGADLRNANLRGANLRGANLRGANLSYAFLVGAELACTSLADAFLRGAVLAGADLSGAVVDASGGHWDAPCWPWLRGHRYDAEMRTPGVVRIGCTTMSVDEWLGEQGQKLAETEGCLGSLEQQTLVSWLEMLRDVDAERLGWRAGGRDQAVSEAVNKALTSK